MLGTRLIKPTLAQVYLKDALLRDCVQQCIKCGTILLYIHLFITESATKVHFNERLTTLLLNDTGQVLTCLEIHCSILAVENVKQVYFGHFLT